MRLIIVLAVCIAVIAAAPQPINEDASLRIVGGFLTTINQYPAIAAVLSFVNGVTFVQSCGGSIINNRSILTAAHCLFNMTPFNIRIRLGSSFASSGGIVHNANRLILHQNCNPFTFDADIAIVRSATTFTFSNVVAIAAIAGTNYNAADNSIVWAAGWGIQWAGGPASEQLRHVQIWTVNQSICAQRYGSIITITSNMLCAGWLDVGGRGQCNRDSGGPLYHNGVVVGVTSFSSGCGEPYFPGVNARVSSFTTWIQANA